MGFTIEKQEIDLRELVLDLINGFLKKVARADNSLGTLVDGGLDRLNAGSRRVLARPVIGISDLVGFGKILDAVPGAFIEGLVIDIAHVGDEGDFIGIFRFAGGKESSGGKDQRQDKYPETRTSS